MKSFAFLAVVGAAMAQDLGSLPQCGQTCIGNMLAIAQSSFGCAQGDVVCYCTNQNFGYGVRDCAREACGDENAANQVIAFGTNYCASIAQSASASATAISTGALGVLSSALASATGSAASGASSATESLASGASSATDSLASGASSATSSAGSALESATSSIASEASFVTSSLASEASSVASDASSRLSSIASGASSTLASITSQLGSASGSGGVPSQTSGNGAAQMTGLPLAGAAGIAAWLLL